jgi:hypothetical protein
VLSSLSEFLLQKGFGRDLYERVLDLRDRISEVLLGLITILTLACALGVAAACSVNKQVDPRAALSPV